MTMSEVARIYVDAPVDQVIRAVGDVLDVRELAAEHGAAVRLQEVIDQDSIGFGGLEVSLYDDGDWPATIARPGGGPPIDLKLFPLKVSITPGYDEEDRLGAWVVFGGLASSGFRAALSYDDRVVRAESY